MLQLSELSVPYGYNLEGQKMVENDHEQRVLAHLELWWVEGMSFNAMAARLDQKNIPTKRSKGIWQPAVVSKILRRSIC